MRVLFFIGSKPPGEWKTFKSKKNRGKEKILGVEFAHSWNRLEKQPELSEFRKHFVMEMRRYHCRADVYLLGFETPTLYFAQAKLLSEPHQAHFIAVEPHVFVAGKDSRVFPFRKQHNFNHVQFDTVHLAFPSLFGLLSFTFFALLATRYSVYDVKIRMMARSVASGESGRQQFGPLKPTTALLAIELLPYSTILSALVWSDRVGGFGEGHKDYG